MRHSTGLYSIRCERYINLSNIFHNINSKDNYENYTENSKMNLGFHAGVVVEIPITEMFSIEPGLLIATKGMKMVEEESYGGETYKVTAAANLYYLDIPINLRVGFDVGGAKIFGLVGPYIGYGIRGKLKTKVEVGSESETETEDIEWGNDPETHDLKRPDFGVTIGAGAQFSAIEVSVSYGLGLANISSYTEDGTITNNRVWESLWRINLASDFRDPYLNVLLGLIPFCKE